MGLHLWGSSNNIRHKALNTLKHTHCFCLIHTLRIYTEQFSLQFPMPWQLKIQLNHTISDLNLPVLKSITEIVVNRRIPHSLDLVSFPLSLCAWQKWPTPLPCSPKFQIIFISISVWAFCFPYYSLHIIQKSILQNHELLIWNTSQTYQWSCCYAILSSGKGTNSQLHWNS